MNSGGIIVDVRCFIYIRKARLFLCLFLSSPVHEHHLLPISEDIPIVVNEKEATSIIAYTLRFVNKLLDVYN